MPYSLTQFANQPVTTVSSGGTGAPSSGSSEQWTVSSSSGFPAASVSSTPPTLFHVADTVATSEIIAVTAVTGVVWGVTRGAENTTPVTHSAGFAVQQVVTAGDLGAMQQNEQCGATATTSVAASTVSGTLATYTPAPGDIPAPGVCYDITAFGVMSNTGTGTGMTLATIWNGTTLATAVSGVAAASTGTLPTSMTTSSFWLEGKVHCFGATTMVSGFNLSTYNGHVGASTQGTLIGGNSNPTGVTVSGTAGPLTVIAHTGANNTFTVASYLIHRIS